MTALAILKKSHYSKSLIFMLLIVDMMMLSFAFFVSNFVLHDALLLANRESQTLLIISNLGWIVASTFSNVYHIDNLKTYRKIFWVVLFSLMLCVIIIGVYSFLINPGYFSLNFILYFFVLSYLLITATRISEWKMYTFLRSVYSSKKNVVVVGFTKPGKRLSSYFIKNGAANYNFLGFFDENTKQPLREQYMLGQLKDIQNFCIRENVDEIYYALPNHAPLVDKLAKFADDNYIHFGLVQDVEGLSNQRIDTHLYDDGKIPIVTPRRDPLRYFFNRQVKRAFDIFFSFLVISLLFPFIVPIVGLAIKLNSKGPIFFRQMRSGKNGKPFWCYKFRTMTVNNESDSKQASKNDSRITKVGAFLRKTSLDEFPQFYNVLIGDMSVVGPRPHMLKHTEEYSAIIDNFKVRHFINSGITGYAQVNGYRGETKDNSQMEKRVIYDNWYLENWSLSLDIKIIIKTVVNAIRGEKNAY